MIIIFKQDLFRFKVVLILFSSKSPQKSEVQLCADLRPVAGCKISYTRKRLQRSGRLITVFAKNSQTHPSLPSTTQQKVATSLRVSVSADTHSHLQPPWMLWAALAVRIRSTNESSGIWNKAVGSGQQNRGFSVLVKACRHMKIPVR